MESIDDQASAINETTSATSQASNDKDDNYTEILQEAVRLYEDDKVLCAACLLQLVNPKHYEAIHHHIVQEGNIFQQLLEQSSDHHHKHCTRALGGSSPKGDEWIKQGERHGRYNFCIYYKISKENHLTCRIETPIAPDMLVPLLSVLNESELYQTWIPQYKVPKFEVTKSEKLRQSGRCGQIIIVETEVQWPLGIRQLLLKAVACDDIDTHPSLNDITNRNNSANDQAFNTKRAGGGKIIVRIKSLNDETDKEELEGIDVPPTKKGYVRMDVEGGFVFEKCPADHPMKESTSADQVLVTFSFSIDPKLHIPQSLMNFFIRVAMGRLWGMFLCVASDVKERKRPAHTEAIARKRESLYNWVEERTRVMLSQSYN